MRSSNNDSAKPTKPSLSSRNLTNISNPDGYINGHGYVDLELPSGTKWATCNIGSNSPEDYGYYLAWGETEPKKEYDNTLLKGVPIDDISNNDNYDVAKIKWGNGWSIPSKNQWDELIQCCKLKVLSMHGIKGVLFIGNNGKTLFFPATGRKLGTLLQFDGNDGYYWSSNADYTYQGKPAYASDAYSTEYVISKTACIAFCQPEWREYGLTIRPIAK